MSLLNDQNSFERRLHSVGPYYFSYSLLERNETYFIHARKFPVSNLSPLLSMSCTDSESSIFTVIFFFVSMDLVL